jgi:hypothetical protein
MTQHFSVDTLFKKRYQSINALLSTLVYGFESRALDKPWLGHSCLQMFIFQILILRFLKEVKSSKALNYQIYLITNDCGRRQV